MQDARVAAVRALGLTPDMAREVQREVLWWVYARVQAGKERRPLLRAEGIGWTSSGYAELLPVEVPIAGRGSVTARLEATVVSTGTERARYLRLPNASRGLAMPGYSAVGRVTAVGKTVTGIAVGDRVAMARARHATIATVSARDAYVVPEDVVAPEAALIYLAIIAGQGLSAAGVGPGDSVCVLGAGTIGILAQRLAAERGAEATTVVARSERSRELAGRGGAHRFLIAGRDDDEIGASMASVVIEATGDPAAVASAIRAARPGGRVVLLGSPRGLSQGVPHDEITARRLELLGAHVDTLPARSRAAGRDLEREEGERFQRILRERRVPLEDLVGERLDPREAGRYYRRLAEHGAAERGWFDWTAMQATSPRGRRSLFAPPDVGTHGLDLERRPLKLKPLPPWLSQDLAEPFAGAAGRLRIGLLGCGDIGVDNAAAAAAAPNTELVACYDPSARLAEQVAAAHGARAAHSPEEIFASADVDAVFLAVPHHLHAPLGAEAAEAGKHVIVEKPLANTLEAGLELTQATERAGVALSVCFPMRYDPRAIIAKRLIAAGALGRLTGTHTRMLIDKPPSYWIGGYSGRAISDWRSSREKAGGGILIMNLSHYLDMTRYLVGVEVEQVSSILAATDADHSVEDAISLGIRYADGAVGSLVGYSAVRGTAREELRVWGHDGHVSVEPDGRVWTLRALDGIRTSRWQRFTPTWGSAQIRAVYLSRLATALHEGREPEIGARDGLAVQAIMEAAYRAGSTGEATSPQGLLSEALA